MNLIANSGEENVGSEFLDFTSRKKSRLRGLKLELTNPIRGERED